MFGIIQGKCWPQGGQCVGGRRATVSRGLLPGARSPAASNLWFRELGVMWRLNIAARKELSLLSPHSNPESQTLSGAGQRYHGWLSLNRAGRRKGGAACWAKGARGGTQSLVWLPRVRPEVREQQQNNGMRSDPFLSSPLHPLLGEVRQLQMSQIRLGLGGALRQTDRTWNSGLTCPPWLSWVNPGLGGCENWGRGCVRHLPWYWHSIVLSGC